MFLTDEEKRMRGGEKGEAARISMELLTRVGEAYGAERMVEVRSVHSLVGFIEYEASVEHLERFAGMGARTVVPTTVNPTHLPANFDLWPDCREPDRLKSNVRRAVAAVKKMGYIPNFSCIPYFQGNLPRFKQCVSWVESSAISFVNSVVGARTNRTTAGLEIASAVTGRVPEFGLLLDENRRGNALVKVEFQPRSLFDYHTIGYFIGKTIGDSIPVIEGLPLSTTANELKAMGAAAACGGMVPLYHAVGITPEAGTREQAFQGNKPGIELKIGPPEVKATIEGLNTYRGGKIDAVMIGCPHPLMEEIEELVRLLDGRKVRADVKFCLFASSDVISRAREIGYAGALEQAGVTILEGECATFHPVKYFGWKAAATNSAKRANSLPADPTNIEAIYADTRRCVELATT